MWSGFKSKKTLSSILKMTAIGPLGNNKSTFFYRSWKFGWLLCFFTIPLILHQESWFQWQKDTGENSNQKFIYANLRKKAKNEKNRSLYDFASFSRIKKFPVWAFFFKLARCALNQPAVYLKLKPFRMYHQCGVILSCRNLKEKSLNNIKLLL